MFVMEKGNRIEMKSCYNREIIERNGIIKYRVKYNKMSKQNIKHDYKRTLFSRKIRSYKAKVTNNQSS